MEHHFSVDVAIKYGVNAAIILNNMQFWIEKNKANEQNHIDGYYWTYNSRKAFKELFPYMSERQIETALKKLIDAGIIITGNYNKSAYDRTLWYAITKTGYSISHFEEMEDSKMLNGNSENVSPIPYNKPYKETQIENTDNKHSQQADIISSVVTYLNTFGFKYKDSTPKTRDLIKARLKEGFVFEDFQNVIQKKYNAWHNTDMEKYIRPETLFGTKFESYLNEKGKTTETEPNYDNVEDLFKEV